MSDPKRYIVVVDDDAGMKLALERLLKAAGFEAVTFGSAEALLESGAAANAACMVLDVHLPGLSGFELRRRLGEAGTKPPPAIFITAYEDPASQVEAEKSGAIAYFTKPFPGKRLLAAITEALGPA